MKRIKNVLEQFDGGNRSLILQYYSSPCSPDDKSTIERSPYNTDAIKRSPNDSEITI